MPNPLKLVLVLLMLLAASEPPDEIAKLRKTWSWVISRIDRAQKDLQQ